MNLHNIVRGVISSVNPDVSVTIKFFEGYTTDEAGIQMPLYSEPVTTTAQMQPATSEDLGHINGFNDGSVYKNFWLTGGLDSVSRIRQEGGDLIQVGDEVYLTITQNEEWTPTAGWVHVIAVLQEVSK